MNNPNSGSSYPFPLRDRLQLPGVTHRENFEPDRNLTLSALRSPTNALAASSPSLSLLHLPETRVLPLTLSTWDQMAGAGAAGLVASAHQSKIEAIGREKLKNNILLRSLMDQNEQLAKYEEHIRSRMMMLSPTVPVFQGQFMNDSSRFLMGSGIVPSFFTQQLPTRSELTLTKGRSMRGGVIEPFPERLHRLLLEVEAAGRADVISFVANGRAFLIHKPDQFFEEIVPKYFRQSQFSSFKRQLNLYGFEWINSGPHRGGYFHKSFLKDQPELTRKMRRIAVKTSTSDVPPLPDLKGKLTCSDSKQDEMLSFSGPKEYHQDEKPSSSDCKQDETPNSSNSLLDGKPTSSGSKQVQKAQDKNPKLRRSEI